MGWRGQTALTAHGGRSPSRLVCSRCGKESDRYYNDEHDVAGLCGACTAMQKEADHQANPIVEALGLVTFFIFVIWLFYQMPGSWFWTVLLLSFFLIRNVLSVLQIHYASPA
jgi:uncharacterized protein (DUF983 family)